MKNLLTLLLLLTTFTLSAAEKPKGDKWQKFITGHNPAVSVADADRIVSSVFDHCGYPYIAFALILRESSFIPTAKGKAGEIGLMQVSTRIHGMVSDNPDSQIAQGCKILDRYIAKIIKANPDLKKDSEELKTEAMLAYKLGITKYFKR